jgi:hypothetical protein
VHWNTSWLLQEAHTTDIVGMDNYPIAHRPITDVSAVVDVAVQAGKPLWFVPQIFNWQDYPWDFRAETGRDPTRDEMRAMTYLATNHGAKGIIYYSYFNIILHEDTFEARWEEIKGIGNEIQFLKPVFLSTDQTDTIDVLCNQADIDFQLFREDNAYYLIAVNTKDEAISDVSFEILVPHPNISVDVMFENGRKIDTVNDFLSDDFSPYDVHVYRWSETCYYGDFDSDGDVDGTDIAMMASRLSGTGTTVTLGEIAPYFGTDDCLIP